MQDKLAALKIEANTFDSDLDSSEAKIKELGRKKGDGKKQMGDINADSNKFTPQ